MKRHVSSYDDVAALLAKNPDLAKANPHIKRPEITRQEPQESPQIQKGPEIAKKKEKSAQDRMNATEREMWAILENEKREGAIQSFDFESLTFVIGEPPIRYTPDFSIWLNDGSLRCVETKGGFIREAAMVRFKVATKQYPLVDWQMWQRKNREWKQIL